MVSRIARLIERFPTDSLLVEVFFLARYTSIGAFAIIFFQDNPDKTRYIIIGSIAFIAATFFGAYVGKDKKLDKREDK